MTPLQKKWRFPVMALGVLLALVAGIAVFQLWKSHFQPRQPPPAGALTRTSDTLNASSSRGGAANARFACASALLINESNTPAAAEVFDAFKAELAPGLKIVSGTWGTPNFGLPPGSRLPDLVIRFNLGPYSEKGTPSRRGITARAHIELGQALWASRNFFNTSDSLPLMQIRWEGTLEHQSELLGIDRAPLARHLGAKLAEAVRKEIGGEREKYGAMPTLPEEFQGPYQPAPALSLPDGAAARQVLSGSRLFTRNETYWIIDAPTPLPELFAALELRYRRQGWRGRAEPEETAPFLRLSRDNETLEFYPIGETVSTTGGTGAAPHLPIAARYVKIYGPAERTAAIGRMMTGTNLPAETLFLFWNLANADQQREIAARISKEGSASAAVWLGLSRVQPPGEALASLKKARALLVTMEEPESLKREIGEAAKKLGGALILTAGDYREAGFEELRGPLETERPQGRPLLLYQLSPGNSPEAFCLEYRKADGSGEEGELVMTEERKNGRACGRIRQRLTPEPGPGMGFGNGKFQARVSMGAAPGGVRYAIEPR